MDSHERGAIAARIAAIDDALEKIPKGIAARVSVDRWRNLLEEKEQLEIMLAANVRKRQATPGSALNTKHPMPA
jgi:hypothetical protein